MHTPPIATLGLIADVQYADRDPSWGRHYRQSLAKLDRAVTVFNGVGVDAVIQLGDTIDTGQASFAPVLERFDRLTAPVYGVLGNHEFDEANPSSLLGRLGLSHRYHAWSLGEWRFIALDTTELSTFANPPGSPGRERADSVLAELRAIGSANAVAWNGGVSATQLDWLAAELDDSRAAGQRVVILSHMPVVGRPECTVWNSGQLLKVVGAHGHVAAWLSGHDHRGAYTLAGGVHHVTLRGMVEYDNAFALLHIHEQWLVIAGFDAQPSFDLSLRATRVRV